MDNWRSERWKLSLCCRRLTKQHRINIIRLRSGNLILCFVGIIFGRYEQKRRGRISRNNRKRFYSFIHIISCEFCVFSIRNVWNVFSISHSVFSLGRELNDIPLFARNSLEFLRGASAEPGFLTMLSNPKVQQAYTSVKCQLYALETEVKAFNGGYQRKWCLLIEICRQKYEFFISLCWKSRIKSNFLCISKQKYLNFNHKKKIFRALKLRLNYTISRIN